MLRESLLKPSLWGSCRGSPVPCSHPSALQRRPLLLGRGRDLGLGSLGVASGSRLALGLGGAGTVTGCFAECALGTQRVGGRVHEQGTRHVSGRLCPLVRRTVSLGFIPTLPGRGQGGRGPHILQRTHPHTSTRGTALHVYVVVLNCNILNTCSFIPYTALCVSGEVTRR